MVRLIKRYESRKLYDTEESRYVSLEEIAAFVRRGQRVQVVDNANGEDVTTQTLAQIILEEGKAGRSRLTADILHDLIRAGERALSSGVEQMQQGVDRLLQASIERVGPLREAREEMHRLRSRLDDLEGSLRQLETSPKLESPPKATKKTTKKATKRAAKKAAGKKSRKKRSKKAKKTKKSKKSAKTTRTKSPKISKSASSEA